MTEFTLYEQLERLHVMLGGNPDDMLLVEEHEAVELLDLLTEQNRKALLHVATVAQNTDGDVEIDFIVAVANLHQADAATVALAWGWTPRPGQRISQQQHIALRLMTYFLGAADFESECGRLSH